MKTFRVTGVTLALLSLVLLVGNFAGLTGRVRAIPASQTTVRAMSVGNKLLNPSFESGLAPWSFQVDHKGGGAQSQDSSTHAVGSYSEKVTISQADTHHPEYVQLRQEGLSFVAGQKISVSFFAKSASARSIQVVLQDTDVPHTLYDTENFNITSDWEAYQFEFTPRKNGQNVFLGFNLDGASSTVWLDSAFVGIPTNYFRGLNIFGAWQRPYGSPDAWANSTQLAYYANKHLATFRYLILWDDLQPTLGGPLDSAYLAGLDSMLSRAHQNGERVSLTFINHAARPIDSSTAVGSSAVPLSDWTDVWTKLVQHITSNPTDNATVWAWDLDNEPYMDPTWQTHDAQATINAIRAVDMTKAIIAMPRDEGIWGYRPELNFQGYSDSANNIWYEDHIYFDANSYGQYNQTYDQSGAYPTVGIDRVQPFVNWCAAHAPGKCIVGETGIPGGWASGDANYTYDNPTTALPTNDPRWNTCLDNFLTYLDQQGISETYWNAGPYGDANSVEPALVNGQEYDRPQLLMLEKHLGNWQP